MNLATELFLTSAGIILSIVVISEVILRIGNSVSK